MRTLVLRITVPAVITLLTGCTQSKPSADEAKKFLDDAQVKLNDLGVATGYANTAKDSIGPAVARYPQAFDGHRGSAQTEQE